MSITDKLGDIAVDLITSAIADKAVDLAVWLATEIFGDDADDDAKEAIARGALLGAAAAAAALAQERKAAGELDAKAVEVLGAIARIDVAALFTPKPHGHAGPVSAKFTCELTHESWMKLRAADPGITTPTDGEITVLGAVGVLGDTVITISDEDRRVPPHIARILNPDHPDAG